jgi:GTP pyrophosphokinase
MGALVNGRNVTFRYILKNGDYVSVLTSKNQKPTMGWLSIVVTGKSKTRIKQALNEERVAEAAKGREMLTRRLKNWKINFSDILVNRLLTNYSLKNAQDLYFKISTEEIELLGIKEFLLTTDGTVKPHEAPEIPVKETREGREQQYSDYLVIENKIEGIDYRLSKCCNPVYGDSVFGFVTILEGIKIHRTACPNAHNMISRYPYRVLPARWAETDRNPSFIAAIKVSGSEDIGIVSRITDVIAAYKITTRGFNYNVNDGLFEGVIQVSVPNVNILYGLIKKIQSLKGITRAIRADQ